MRTALLVEPEPTKQSDTHSQKDFTAMITLSKPSLGNGQQHKRGKLVI
jgi:hypothetical protein